MGDGPTKNKLSRRDFFKAAGLGLGSLFFGEFADIMLFQGFVTSHLLRAKNDPEYRDRLLNTIKQGRLDDKLKMEINERLRPYDIDSSLGEPLDMKEDILDQGFEKYEIRQLTVSGETTNNLMLVANLGSNIGIYNTARTPDDQYNLTQTMIDQGNCFTIPSAYVTVRADLDYYMLDSYSSYEQNGKVNTYSEDKIEFATGAIILNENGTIRVVDRPEITKYEAGINCKAIQSYGIAISSDTLDSDLKSLSWMSYSTGGNAARSRDNACFMMTLSDTETGKEESLLLSVYQHYDLPSDTTTGNEWQLGLSMEQVVGICEQLALERKYDKFVLVGPDPNHAHSRINGPIIVNDDAPQNSILRQFDYWSGPLLKESDSGLFQPPIFLGAKLPSSK